MVMRHMYLYDAPAGFKLKLNPLLGTVAGALLLAVVYIGVYPGPAFEVADEAAQALFEVSAVTVVTGE